MSKLYNKYINILKSGVMSELEIMNFRSVIAGSKGSLDDIQRQQLKEQFYILMPEQGYRLTIEHSTKGIEFLRRFTFKKTGSLKVAAIRCLGEREIDAIKDYAYFTFTELYSHSPYNDYTLPVYSLYTNEGHGFDYYYDSKVNVIG